MLYTQSENLNNEEDDPFFLFKSQGITITITITNSLFRLFISTFLMQILHITLFCEFHPYFVFLFVQQIYSNNNSG